MRRVYLPAVVILVIAAVAAFLFAFAGLPGGPGPASSPGTNLTSSPETLPATLPASPEATLPSPRVNGSRETPVPVVPPERRETTVKPTANQTVPVKTLVTMRPPPFPVPAGPAKGDPYSVSPAGLADRVHELINDQRALGGLPGLSTDTVLAGIAAGHSADMAANRYFDHRNPAGQSPTDRGTAVGYSCRKDYGSYYTYGIAENIYQNNLYTEVTYYSNGTYEYNWTSQEQIAQTTVEGWMNSTGHRENILTPTYDREGIGVAISTDDRVFITEDFC